MKKIFLTFALCSFVALGAFAQMTGGLKAGLNLANVGGDDAEDASMRIAFHVGGYLNFALSEKIAIQPELLYNSVGAKYEYTDFDPDLGEYDVEETWKLNYISIPVMLVYNITEQFNVQAGPQIGILASAKADIDAGDLGSEDGIDVKDVFKGTDFGFNIGLGFNASKLNFAARYSLGLSEIPEEEGSIKNNVIQISVGYKLFGE